MCSEKVDVDSVDYSDDDNHGNNWVRFDMILLAFERAELTANQIQGLPLLFLEVSDPWFI